MLHLNLDDEFKAGPVRALRGLAPVAESLRAKLFKGFGPIAVSAVGGWGAAVVVGAALMAGGAHQSTPGASAPEIATVATPAAPAVVASTPAPALTAPAQTAQAPAPAKTTQRIDMAPVAAIPDPAKLKHKHKKKKELDAAN